MKWIALAAALLFIGPFSLWFRGNPARHPLVWTIFGFLAVQHGPLKLYIAPISWGAWPGYVKGAELSAVDVLAFAIYLGLPHAAPSFPFRATIGLYLCVVLMSALQAQETQPALFYAWQLARISFVALILSRAIAADKRVLPSLLNGLAVAMILAAATAAWDRMVWGVLQAGGSFGHQNTLGLMTHFVTFPFLAILLAGGTGWRPLVVPIMGGVVAVLTVSRATIGLIGIGYLTLFILSTFRGWSSRKSKVALIGLVTIGIMAPFVIASVQERLGQRAFLETDQERVAFEKVSAMMLADHPFGVGSNQWVLIANTHGYSDRAGVATTFGSRSAHVHNVYWLVAAETGYLGIFTYMLMIAHPLLKAFSAAWQHRDDPTGDVLLGLGMALLIVYLHSSLEWLLVSFQPQYLFGVTIGMIAGLTHQLNPKRSSRGTPPIRDERKRKVLYTIDN